VLAGTVLHPTAVIKTGHNVFEFNMKVHVNTSF